MPIYEFHCQSCNGISERYFHNTDAPRTLACKNCDAGDAQRIVSGATYLASDAAKVARFDPKYEKMVDRAMHNSRSADLDRVLSKLKPFPKKP
jgi:putative FmdB family regulatory protein